MIEFGTVGTWHIVLGEHNMKFNKIISVEYTDAYEKMYDIEVDHPDHFFIAKSENGAIGISHNSATLSLSNLSDDRMRNAKNGQWWVTAPQRALANNSVAYTEKPDIEIFLREWLTLIESKSGERGIFNRVSVQKKAAENGRRKSELVMFTNPCITGDSLLNVRLDGREGVMRIDCLSNLRSNFSKIEVLTNKDGVDVYSEVTDIALTKKNTKVLKIVDQKTGKFIKCTPDHLIFTKKRGWQEAQNLVEDDELVLVS